MQLRQVLDAALRLGLTCIQCDLVFKTRAAVLQDIMPQCNRCHAESCNTIPGCCFLHGRGAVEKKTVLENLDLVLLAMDEVVDGG